MGVNNDQNWENTMARMTITVQDDTRQKLIELAGGERKVGVKIDALVAAEYARQTTSLEELAKRVDRLERLHDDGQDNDHE